MGGITFPVTGAGGHDPVIYTVPLSLPAVQLASAVASLPAGGTTSPVQGVPGAAYIFSYVFTGSGLVLETLGPDGATWQTVVTVNATGQQGVVIGDGAFVRLRNSSGSAITGLSASLS